MLTRRTTLDDGIELVAKAADKAASMLVTQFAPDHASYAKWYGRAQGIREALEILKNYHTEINSEH